MRRSQGTLWQVLASGQAHEWARWCGLAVAVGGTYALLHQIGAWFIAPSGGAAFYPPAGFALAMLALTPRKTWPLWLAAFAVAHTGIDVAHHRPEPDFLVYTAADILEPLVGALLLAAAVRRWSGPRAALVAFALLPVAVSPFIAGAAGSTAYVLLGQHIPWWTWVSAWWVGDALGVLAIGGVILAWARPAPFEDPPPLVGVAAVAAVGAGAIITTGVLWHYPLVYIVLPSLVWAAVVGGARAVTTVGAAAAIAAYWVALTGRADRLLGSAHPGERLQFLQLLIGVTFLTGLLLAVEIAERRRSEHEKLQAQQQLAASERAAVKLAQAERHSIAQDTHDIVGHGLNAMLLQVGAARRVVGTDPAMACDLLASTEAIGRKACGELDMALAMIAPEDERGPGLGLGDLPELVSALGAAGLVVDLRVEGERGELSTLVDWSAYRIVREALTNVLKHAPGATTSVTVRLGDDALHISVVDDGGAANGDRSYSEGRGIIGMRERAAALGGTLDVHHHRRGFMVSATLPTVARR